MTRDHTALDSRDIRAARCRAGAFDLPATARMRLRIAAQKLRIACSGCGAAGHGLAVPFLRAAASQQGIECHNVNSQEAPRAVFGSETTSSKWTTNPEWRFL